MLDHNNLINESTNSTPVNERPLRQRGITPDSDLAVNIQAAQPVESTLNTTSPIELVALPALRPEEIVTESLVATSEANEVVYSLTQNIFPRIVINDDIGVTGSQQYATGTAANQEFAQDFSAVVEIGGCSGTLIAPNVVLSARHCGIGAGTTVSFGPDSFNPVYTTTVLNATNPGGGFAFSPLLDGGDVTIARLAESVPEDIATPMRLTSNTELEGERVAIIGYGLNGVGSQGHQFSSDGLRWGGENVIDQFGAAAGSFGATSNIISTDFDDESGGGNTIAGSNPTPLEFEATTAPGDSGGPILINAGGEWLIAGVLSGGTSPISAYGDISWWTGIAIYEEEITEAGGEFTGGLPEEDDHLDVFPDALTTFLSFDPLSGKFIGRDTGFIGFAEVVDDVDVFGFSLASEGDITIDARSQTSNLDTYLEIYDAEGRFLGANDNSGNPALENELDSQLILRDIAAGEYFVAVSSVDETLGRYRVAVRHNADLGGVDDVGSSFSTSAIVGLNPAPDTTFINAAVDFGDDKDFFQFVANFTGTLVIRTKALEPEDGELNTVLRGYDSDRNLIAANNNFRDSLDSRLVLDIEEGEQYFLQLSSVGTTYGDYRISLRLNDEATGGSDGFSDFGRVDLAMNKHDWPGVDMDDKFKTMAGNHEAEVFNMITPNV